VKLSIRTKLLAALGVDLLLMLVLGSFALHQMSIMNQKADFVVNQTILSIDLVNAMNDIILNYRTRQMGVYPQRCPSRQAAGSKKSCWTSNSVWMICPAVQRQLPAGSDGTNGV
jgi:hypothetical protein